jgi:hypothetical protein
MRRFLTYVGMYAIASVIGALVYVFFALVGISNKPKGSDWLLLPIYLTLLYLFLSLPFVFVLERRFYRFGFVKGITAYHLIIWLVLSFYLSLNKSEPFTEAILSSIFLFFLYLLPITLGAIIMKWLTQKLSQVRRLAFVDYCMYTLGENFRKSEKIILRSIRTLLTCLHSLFRKVLFK